MFASCECSSEYVYFVGLSEFGALIIYAVLSHCHVTERKSRIITCYFFYQEVKDTIDKKAILALMTECYENHAIDKKKLEELKYIQLEGIAPSNKNSGLSKAGESILKGFKVIHNVLLMITFVMILFLLWRAVWCICLFCYIYNSYALA